MVSLPDLELRGRGYLPCAPSSGKSAVQPLSPPLIPHLLLPERDVGAIIADLGIQRREWSAEDDIWGLLRCEIGLVRGARSLVGHGEA